MDTTSANIRETARSALKRSGFTSNNWLLGLIITVIIINLVITLAMLTQLHATSLPVPIRYTSLTHFDQLGSWQTLYIIPALMWVFTAINIWLAHAVYHRSRITSFMVVIATFGYGLLALQTTWLYLGVIRGTH